MAYDTIKLRSPGLGRTLVDQIERKCILRSGEHMETGEVLYEIFGGELLGSWDARISVMPKDEEWTVNKNGRPEKRDCDPYVLIEASVHKIFHGHNVYGGPTDFLKVCRNFVALVEKLLGVDLPVADIWTVHRVDVALVYRLPKAAIFEFFRGVQLVGFPRRGKGALRTNHSFHFPGKTTTVKGYHKGSEFAVHERNRLKNFFEILFGHLYGVGHPDNRARVDRKIRALQRLADNRLRIEVGINADKFQYDFEKNPQVNEVSDAYLESVFDREVEKLLREGKQRMDTVRNSSGVMARLQNVHGNVAGARLHGFWSCLCQHGDDYTKGKYSKPTFYRNRKHLEEAGVSWLGSDVVVVANDGCLPVDFAPVRSDRRLCFLPARDRLEFQMSRELMSLAA